MSVEPGPKPPLLQRMLPGIFYGWVIVGASSLLAFVVVGVGFYCLAVFLDGLSRVHSWPRSSVALATSLFFVTAGLCGILVGRWVDRLGPRVFFVPGALVMAAALIWIGRIDEPQQLYLAYPLLALGFAAAGGVPNNALITRWFVARRARAMSISQTGVSLGGVVLVPVATQLIVSRGLAVTTEWLALLVVAVVLIVTAIAVRSDPESIGLEPDGDGSHSLPTALDLEAQRRIWTPREVLATRAFWIVVVAFSGILFCQVGTAMHQIALLRDRMDATTAAFAVSATATGSIVARLVVGHFADRWSKRHLGAALMLIQSVAVAIFALASATPLLYAASLLFGFTIGNLFMLQSLIIGELFGIASFGTVFGLLQMLTQLASGLGPYLLSLSVESLGSYRIGLLPLVVLAVLSAAVLIRLRPPPPVGAARASSR